MAVRIDKKIKGYAVVTPEDKAKEAIKAEAVTREAAEAELTKGADVIQMHERIERPLQRFGAWIERTSHENLAWALAIIGFLLVRHAWMAGARPPWM